MASVPAISDQSTVVAIKDQVSCDLAGEAAILNITSGVYYGLDPVGARIWSLMQQPRQVSAIQSAIMEEYDVEPERCAQDLKALSGNKNVPDTLRTSAGRLIRQRTPVRE